MVVSVGEGGEEGMRFIFYSFIAIIGYSAQSHAQQPNLFICDYGVYPEKTSLDVPDFDHRAFFDDFFVFTRESGLNGGDKPIQAEYRFMGGRYAVSPYGPDENNSELELSIAGPAREGPAFAEKLLADFARHYNWYDYHFKVRKKPLFCEKVYCEPPCNGMPIE